MSRWRPPLSQRRCCFARPFVRKVMGDVCKEANFAASVCSLTRSTGLSLAETIVLAAREGEDASGLVGHATTFFSYSWTGTKLGDMLTAIQNKVSELEAADGRRRFVWVDMFAASQTLLAGEFRDEASHPKGSPGYKERKEDTDTIFDHALDAIEELLLYASPLNEQWRAPQHPYLLPDIGDPPPDWMRRGPGAMTRAWCMFEMVKALAKPARLHVVLSPADVSNFEELLTKHFDDIAGIIADLDARKAQVSKPEDRDYILGQVRMLDGGLGTVTSTVCSSLRGWLAEQGRKVLQSHHEDNGEQNIIRLKDRVASLLQAQGDLAGAEPLFREALQARREVLGDRHPDTLASVNNLASLLQAKEGN